MLDYLDPEERRRKSQETYEDTHSLDHLIQSFDFNSKFNKLADAANGGGTGSGGGVPALTYKSGVGSSTLPGTAGANSSVLGSIGSFLGKNWLPLSGIASQLLGALFGPQGPSGYGGAVSPEATLTEALNATNGLGRVLQNNLAKGQSTPSAYVQPGPAPVNIPGLNFQIGGGFGMDPAFRDPSLLTRPGIDFMGMEPFGPQKTDPSLRSKSSGTPTGQSAIKRRSPGGGA